MNERILKVNDGEDVYWMEGHDAEEAKQSFGVNSTSEPFLAIPFDPNLTEFENIEAAWQKALDGGADWDESLPIPKDIMK